MAIIEKTKFIEKYTLSLKRLLEKELKDDMGFESEMLNNAEKIIDRRISNSQGGFGTIEDF